MAKLSEILAIEKDRSEREKWCVAHLFKEGSFYRAYEWSAWLIVSALANDPGKKISVTRRGVSNGDDTFVHLGFPLTSTSKFLPGLTHTPVNDTQIDFVIQIAFPQDSTYDSVFDAFCAWKESFQIKEEKRKKGGQEASENHPQSITGVMRQILSWPLEAKTPMENSAFISRLKQELADLI